MKGGVGGEEILGMVRRPRFRGCLFTGLHGGLVVLPAGLGAHILHTGVYHKEVADLTGFAGTQHHLKRGILHHTQDPSVALRPGMFARDRSFSWMRRRVIQLVALTTFFLPPTSSRILRKVPDLS